ncbi:YlxQ family RNA-binding protein [Halobacillus salinarum]|uniref:YlxQ family RNA-binding protein n=1 Tax=Halobacillus salinarum TaxID=2932257 RepID=A0ABY4EG27_9BACI|nr:YlxQ family RNA-binding protein [Halobacillus salinarum]UOQ43018.1 YlxQ family RNA-binding protein [Halobacillus salinarum]
MNKHLNLLGLAVRAGQCTIGEEAIVRDIQKQKAKIVLLAGDIGTQTKKKLTDKCSYYHIPYYMVEERDTLSHAIGKEGRVAIAVLDHGFAKKLQSLLDESIRG